MTYQRFHPELERYAPKYSGTNCSGICICGCDWDRHHLSMVARMEYIDQTGEPYIAQECCRYGSNEAGGLMPVETANGVDWQPHCHGYRDRGIIEGAD